MKLFHYLSILLPLFCFSLTSTSEAKSRIKVSVVDSFDKQSPDSITIKVTNENGDVIFDAFIERPFFKDDYGIEHRFIVAPNFPVDAPGKYIFNISTPHHTPQTLTAETSKDEEQIDLGFVKLDKVIELDEVKVVASKVKMVMKGDTIVYNADAFNLAKGSMLDKLIAMLPGAEINDKGQIWVNGEFVSSLLINGKDFFKGNPSVAMQNIPYYSVNQVKVYRQEPDNAYLKERTETEKKHDPLVMDVLMKEKFLGTYLGHADVAGGTEKRYSLRTFLSAFGKKHNFAVYGNINNVGANSNPSQDGKIWQTGMAGIFDNVYRSAGLTYNYMTEDRRKRVILDANGSSNSNNNNYLSTSSAFYPAGYSTSARTVGDSHFTNGNFDSRLTVSLGLEKVYTAAAFNIGFRRNTGRSGYSFMQHKGEEYLDTLSLSNPDFINKVFRGSRTRTTDFNIGGSPTVNFTLPFIKKNIFVTANAYHYRTTTEEMSVTNNRTSDDISILNNFISNPGHSTNLSLSTGVSHSYKSGLNWDVRYTIEHSDKHNERALSHFLPDSAFSQLPVVTDRLTMISDLKQSFTATTRKLTNKVDISTGFHVGRVNFSFGLPLNWINDRFRDTRAPSINRNSFTFNPSVNIHWKELRFYSSIYNYTPSAEQLLDFTDDSDLLTIRKGNPLLKNPRNFSSNISFSRMIPKRNMNYSLSASFTEYTRAIANALSFNPLDGVSTITAYNVDGNRTGYANAAFGKYFGAMNRFNINANVSARLERSVAFASTGTPDFARSVVHSTDITPNLSLTYSREKYSITAKASINRFLTRGNLDSFIRTNAWSGGPTISGWVRLPFDFQIESSINNSFRTGYADPEMNKSFVYWNASILKSLDKEGKWNLRLDAVDILGQVSSYSRSVNAQGITETRNSVIGRYFLFHIQYHFNFPKKK